MKILYVIGSRLLSGAEDHLLDLAAWFKAHDVETVFLLREKTLLQERLTALEVRSHPVFIPGRKVGLVYRMARAILAEQPDVISINREHNIFPTYLATLLARPFLKRKPKMVAVFHTPTGRHYPGLGTFDGVISTSHYTAKTFTDANPSIRDKSEVIHCGVEIPDEDHGLKLAVERPRRFFDGQKFPIIGMSGEFWKNQEELVDAAHFLVKEFPHIMIAFIGGYEGGERLERKIAAAGLEKNFILTGRIPRVRMPDVFFDLDLSVTTHRNEGFGIVHIESLAAYTPVVAYNSGGLVEILSKGGGLLVDGGTREFSDTIIALLKDHDRRFALGREGRRVVEEFFSVNSMGRRHLSFYQKLIVSGSL